MRLHVTQKPFDGHEGDDPGNHSTPCHHRPIFGNTLGCCRRLGDGGMGCCGFRDRLLHGRQMAFGLRAVSQLPLLRCLSDCGRRPATADRLWISKHPAALLEGYEVFPKYISHLQRLLKKSKGSLCEFFLHFDFLQFGEDGQASLGGDWIFSLDQRRHVLDEVFIGHHPIRSDPCSRDEMFHIGDVFQRL